MIPFLCIYTVKYDLTLFVTGNLMLVCKPFVQWNYSGRKIKINLPYFHVEKSMFEGQTWRRRSRSRLHYNLWSLPNVLDPTFRNIFRLTPDCYLTLYFHQARAPRVEGKSRYQ